MRATAFPMPAKCTGRRNAPATATRGWEIWHDSCVILAPRPRWRMQEKIDMNDVLVAWLAMVWLGSSALVASKARGAGRRTDLWLAASLLASPSFTYGLLLLLERKADGSAYHPSNLPI